MDTLGNADRTAILRDFQNQEYRFPIPKSLIRQTEKQEKEDKEQWQLQSYHINQKVIHYQKDLVTHGPCSILLIIN